MATHSPDYARLRTTLVNSKTHVSNNPLFQTIQNLIDGVKKFTDFADASFTDINSGFGTISDALTIINNDISILQALAINLVEVDGPTEVNLIEVVKGFTIIKDISGLASTNPITLLGTVDNIVNPIISIDWGFAKVYLHNDGTFYSWGELNGGGGSGGSSIADHLATVIAERATYVSGGGTFANNLSILNIAIAVANDLVGIDGAGLEAKTGDNVADYMGTSVSISRICYPDGTLFKILTDSGVGGANGASWTFDGMVSPSRYVHI